jgi:hypothetical protein
MSDPRDELQRMFDEPNRFASFGDLIVEKSLLGLKDTSFLIAAVQDGDKEASQATMSSNRRQPSQEKELFRAEAVEVQVYARFRPLRQKPPRSLVH